MDSSAALVPEVIREDVVPAARDSSADGEVCIRHEVSVQYLGSAELLSSQRKERIRTDMIAALPRHDMRGYLAAKQHLLSTCDHLAIALEGARCVGMSVASEFSSADLDFVYIETLLVAEELHRTAAGSKLISALFGGIIKNQGGLPDLIAMKTYNPQAYVMMSRFVTHEKIAFYPLIGKENPPALASIAVRLARAVAPDSRFDPETGIVYGGAGGVSDDFWPAEPTTGDPRVDRFFAERMTPSDRLLCFVAASADPGKQAIIRRLGI